MREFINTHLSGFFESDNSSAIKKRIDQYNLLMFYHEPKLGLHLEKIGFNPQFYAISWFMTLFARRTLFYLDVFPLEKIYMLWDYVLVMPPLFCIYIALGIVSELKNDILHADFSNVISD